MTPRIRAAMRELEAALAEAEQAEQPSPRPIAPAVVDELARAKARQVLARRGMLKGF